MASKDYSLFSRETLVNLLLKHDEKKKYGIVWDEERIPEKVVSDCQTHLPVLTEIKEKEIITNNDELTHLLIEGDNYHALSVLNYTHYNKINIIYIDPPYNRGEKDFIYNDKYVEKDDTYKHSKWLNFMNKRLELAKELLTDDGVIFISIDDNEVAQLKMLCDKIFGENNFVGQWNWFKSATPPNLSLKIKKNIEYILVYEKIRNNSRFKGLKKASKSDDPFTKPQNTFKTLIFPPRTINFKTKNDKLKAGTYGTDTYPNKLLNDLIIKDFTNENEAIFENRFVWTQEKLNEELKNKTTINCSKSIVLSYKKQDYSEEVPPNLIDENVGVDTTEEAGKRLSEMFNAKVFDYPKPVSLIKYLINFKPELKDEAIILDFFAGSGTTVQAVLELNKEDGGKRQVILCTNNENEICEKVTYPRVGNIMKGFNFVGTQAEILFDEKLNVSKIKKGKELIEKIKKIELKENINFDEFEIKVEKGNIVLKGLKIKRGRQEGLGNNLKYYRTSFVENSKNRDQIRMDVTRRCTEMLCIKEGVYNLKKESDDWKIFEQNGKYLAVYYDFAGLSLEELKNEMNAIEGEKVLYCFTLEREINKIDFLGWKNTRFEAIPQKILDVYKRIFNNQ